METFNFVEPVEGNDCIFALIPLSSLKVAKYQRKLQTTHASRLAASMENGFIVPLLVVEGEGDYEIIDGQHRFAVLQKLFAEKDPSIPCIILPPEFENLPLIYNIEKSDDIKAKSEKVYHLFEDAVESDPERLENTLRHAVDFSYYLIDMGYALMEQEVSALSIIEPAAKKLGNNPMQMSISESREMHKLRGEKLAMLDAMVAAQAAQNNIMDFNLKAAIVTKSISALWEKKRNIEGEYLDLLDNLIAYIASTNWSWMGRR